MIKFKFHAISLAIGLAFSVAAAAEGMSGADYNAGKHGIAADYKSARAACASLSGNANDICRAEAKGGKDVAKAELEERRAPGSRNHYAVRAARAKADYSVAIEKCDDRSGNDKKVCVTEANATRSLAVNDAKAELKSADADRPAGPAPSAARSKSEKPQEYVDDSVITAKVKTAVFEDPMLKSAEINVETYKGIVQLSGFVRSRADINRAVAVARGVRGVSSVENVMIVKGQP